MPQQADALSDQQVGEQILDARPGDTFTVVAAITDALLRQEWELVTIDKVYEEGEDDVEFARSTATFENENGIQFCLTIYHTETDVESLDRQMKYIAPPDDEWQTLDPANFWKFEAK